MVLVLKAVDTAIRLDVAAGVGWLAAAFYAATGRRSGLTMVLLMGAWLLLGGYPSNHLVLLLWTAVALLLFEYRRDLELALTAALSAMYLYAGAAKVWTRWMSGEIVADLWPAWLPMLGDPVVVAQAVIAVELLLGVVVWLRPVPRASAMVATVAHAGITVGMAATWEMTPSIVLFNLLPVAIWWRLSRP